MVSPFDHIATIEHEETTSGQNGKRNYGQKSSGLLLNATSIISGTFSTNEQELKKAGRISFHDSPVKLPIAAKVKY